MGFKEQLKILKEGNLTEQEMRKMKYIFPESDEDLLDLIHVLRDKYNNDYGKSAEAMALAADAAFNYMGAINGNTGFQAGCAVWSFLQKERSDLDNGGMLISYRNILYPQYFNNQKEYFPTRDEILEKSKQYFADEARKLLKTHYVSKPEESLKDYECVIGAEPTEEKPFSVSEEVWKHWEWLASLAEPKEEEIKENEE